MELFLFIFKYVLVVLGAAAAVALFVVWWCIKYYGEAGYYAAMEQEDDRDW